jgi:hypothetical protein
VSQLQLEETRHTSFVILGDHHTLIWKYFNQRSTCCPFYSRLIVSPESTAKLCAGVRASEEELVRARQPIRAEKNNKLGYISQTVAPCAWAGSPAEYLVHEVGPKLGRTCQQPGRTCGKRWFDPRLLLFEVCTVSVSRSTKIDALRDPR